MKVKSTDGRIKDVPITQVTCENYIVPENEKHLYHVIIEVRKFNSETGERMSKPRVQKFGKKAFETKVRKNLIKQGYTLTMLHEAEQVSKKPSIPAPASKPDVEALVSEAVAKALAESEAKHKKEIEEAVAKALAEVSAPATSKKGRKTNAEKKAEAEAKTEENANEATDGTNASEGVETPTEEF